MNTDERQALRDRHAEEYGVCVYCLTPDPEMRGRVLVASYPCDVIKVLYATEELKPNDLKTEVECDHLKGGEIPHTTEGINVWLWFTYCPKCGKKL